MTTFIAILAIIIFIILLLCFALRSDKSDKTTSDFERAQPWEGIQNQNYIRIKQELAEIRERIEALEALRYELSPLKKKLTEMLSEENYQSLREQLWDDEIFDFLRTLTKAVDEVVSDVSGIKAKMVYSNQFQELTDDIGKLDNRIGKIESQQQQFQDDTGNLENKISEIEHHQQELREQFSNAIESNRQQLESLNEALSEQLVDLVLFDEPPQQENSPQTPSPTSKGKHQSTLRQTCDESILDMFTAMSEYMQDMNQKWPHPYVKGIINECQSRLKSAFEECYRMPEGEQEQQGNRMFEQVVMDFVDRLDRSKRSLGRTDEEKAALKEFVETELEPLIQYAGLELLPIEEGEDPDE